MSMIIAGGGAASVFTGEGVATVIFTASGTGRQTGASVPPVISPTQGNSGCNGGASIITVALTNPVASGAFLSACIPLTGGASVVSITDHVDNYDAIVTGLGTAGWWKLNETSGAVAYDSSGNGNNGATSGGVTLGNPGPIMTTPSDTSYGFDGVTGQVQIPASSDFSFGTGSFTVMGWINGATAGSVNGYIFNNEISVTQATFATGPLGWAVRGMGIMGGGLFESVSGGYSLQMNSGTDSLGFTITDTTGNVRTLETPLGYANGWHMVVGVVDRSVEDALTYRNPETYRNAFTYRGLGFESQTMALYVDGQLIGDVDISSIGAISNSGNKPLIGTGVIGDLAEIALVDYALTGSQIAGLYASSFGQPERNRWIQAAYSYNSGSGYGSEIWYARGADPGLTVVTIKLSNTSAACAAVNEFSGVWYQDPLDSWSQNYGTGSVAATQAIPPRAGSDLFLAVVSAGDGLISGPTNGYTSIPLGPESFDAAYLVSPFDVPEMTSWGIIDNEPFAVAHASFVAGPMAVNADLQFPETLVEISIQQNFLAPLEGYGIWENISHYVRAMDIGPLGRQHELDRVQATTATFTMNDRDGSFNVWNTESFLYGGLKPMNPMRCTAAWHGVTSDIFYGYLQAVQPQIGDVLNVDTVISANDILALLNLKYLSNDNYSQLVKADGGANLQAYYRLGDIPNSFSTQDSSGNGNTGSLINGVGGEPTYGATGVMLYDTDGALDCTAGQNTANGGFGTYDYTTENPTYHEPLGGADNWSLELWFQWTGATTVPAPAIIPPGLTTPITHPTGFPAGSYAPTAAGSVVFISPYGAVGDLAIFGVVVNSATNTITEVDGITSDNWTLQARNQDATNGQCVDLWSGIVSSIAAPDVLSLTYSDDTTTPPCYYWIDSMTVGQGANSIWTIQEVGVNQNPAHVTTAVYPALDAGGGTNPQAYWGIGGSSGTMSGGATGGFTYTDLGGSEVTFNDDVFSGSNPWQPTTTITSGTYVTVGAIIEASIATAASTAAVPNAVLMHVAGPNSFEPFTSYELQLGFVEVPTQIAGQTTAITNAVVECFGSTTSYNAFTFASNPFDGGWHYLYRDNIGSTIYLDGKPPTTTVFNQAIGASITGLSFGTSPDGVGLDPTAGNALSTTAQPFTGILDEVSLYSSTLSLAQIEQHYLTALWFQTLEFGAANGAASVARTNKVLAVAGLNPEILLVVPYPFLTEVYAETDQVTTTSALNYIQTTSETEPGVIYQAANGLIYAFSREYQYYNPTTLISQATLSDSANSPYYYDGNSLQLNGDDLDLWTDIQVQSGVPSTLTTEQIEIGVLQEWGPAQSALAAQSASVYGNRTLQGLTSLQMNKDSDALAIAQNYFAWYGVPIVRAAQLVLNAQGNGGANIPLMLQRGLYDLFTIEYTGQTPGPTFSQNSVIEQISHSVTMDIPEWTTTYAMSPYEVLLDPIYLDVSTLDGPDTLTL